MKGRLIVLVIFAVLFENMALCQVPVLMDALILIPELVPADS
jgi:hypothetical protein